VSPTRRDVLWQLLAVGLAPSIALLADPRMQRSWPEVLREKLHKAIETARARIEAREDEGTEG
jgi:hypothetical protein